MLRAAGAQRSGSAAILPIRVKKDGSPFPTASHRRSSWGSWARYGGDLLHQIAREISSGPMTPTRWHGDWERACDRYCCSLCASRRAGAAIRCAISGL